VVDILRDVDSVDFPVGSHERPLEILVQVASAFGTSHTKVSIIMFSFKNTNGYQFSSDKNRPN